MATATLTHNRVDPEWSWKTVSTIPVSGNGKAPSSLLLLLQDSISGILDAGEGAEDAVGAFRLQVKTLTTHTDMHTFLHSGLFTSFHQHETHLAIAFPTPEFPLSGLSSYRTHSAGCRRSAISHKNTSCSLTKQKPWRNKTQPKHTSLPSLHPRVHSQRLKFKHHLYQGTIFRKSQNHTTSQELASPTLSLTP